MRLSFVLNVARVQLELREDLLVLARLKRLLEGRILSNEIHGRARVGLDLSDQVRQLHTIALLRLVNQLVHEAVLAQLDRPRLHLPRLLSVGVVSDLARLGPHGELLFLLETG